MRLPCGISAFGCHRTDRARLVPNECRIFVNAAQRAWSQALRPIVYKTAALPTELHRRVTRCMVADLGPDVLIPALASVYVVVAVPVPTLGRALCVKRVSGWHRL